MIEIFDRLTFHKNMYTKPCYSHDVEKTVNIKMEIYTIILKDNSKS